MEKRLHFTFFDRSVFIKSVIIVCFLSFFSAKAFSQATVSTDQSDYPPGSTVYITGSGFAANETVTLQVLHVGGGDDLTSPAHQPWTVTADASGNISTTWLVPLDQDELGATLQLTATGQTSGLIAQVTFTDNSPPNLAYPATNIFVVGKAVTLTPTNVGGGQPTSTTTSSPLPAGLSISKAGVISGTPTAVSSNTLYTVTTSNAAGTQTPSPTLSIQVVLPPIISYNTPNTFVVGTPVSLSPSNTGSVSNTYSVSPGLPAGLSINTSTGVISGTPTTVTTSGSYTVTATNLASGGTGTFAISITVNPALPSITYPTPDTYVYGTTITSLTPTSSGGAVASYSVNPTLPAGLSLAASTGIISGKPTAATAAADYTVTATNATGPSTFVIHITVNPRPLNVTASGGNKTYDGTTAASVNLSDDRLSGDKLTLTSTANFSDKNVAQSKTVSVTNIAITGGADAANYTLANTTATTTANISPRPLTITANNANKYFGTTLSTVTGSTDFTSSGLQNGETIGSVTLTYNGGAAATDPVGTYTGSIVPSAPVPAPTSAFLASNYSIAYNAGTLTVLAPLLPAPVITYNTPNTFVYGTAITTLTPTNTGGAAASYSIDKTLPSGLSFDTGTGAISGTPTTISAATSYTITAHNTTGDGPFTLSIEIDKASLTITARGQSKVYGSAQNLGTSAFTASALYNSDSISGVTLASDGSLATATVGTYDIVPSAATGSGLSNYSISYVNGKDTVKAAALTITAKNQSKIYGTAQTLGTGAFTPGTLYNGDSVAGVTLASDGSVATATVGTYDITPSAATGNGLTNYSISYINGKDTVKVAALTITAKNQSKIYGTAQTLGTGAFTPGTLYNGDSVAGVTLASDGSVVTATVGTYDIVPSAATGSGLTNYSISYVNGKDTVKAAALTITAKNQSKIYGATQTLGTAAFTPGTLYNGDSVTGVTLTSSGSPGSATVGTYDIVPSAATGSGLSNYSINYVNGKDTVKAAALTITANNQSKIYGSAQTLGTTAFTKSTLYNGDNVTGVTLSSTGSLASANVGTYDITPSAAIGSGLSNYSISYVSGKDTVKVAALTITANNQSKIYGATQTLGTAAFTASTLYNSDQVSSVTLTSSGSPASATVGTYDITPSAATGGGLSNYSISYVNGKDTVKAAALTVTAKNQSKIYGTTQTLGTTAFTTSTLYNGDNVTGVTLSSTGGPASAIVGTYDIVPSAAIGSGLSNYSVSYVNGKDTVKAAALTITAKNQSKIYGTTQTLGTTAFATSTLYNSDSVTGVTLTSSGSPASAIVGTYDILPSAAAGSGLSNYSISYVNGKDTVKVAPLTITAKNQSKIYGSTQTLGTTAFTTSTMYNSDNVTGVTLTSTGSPASAIVGTYDIVSSAATGSGLSNYSISYVNGKDTVKTAALTVTAKNQSKIYGTTQTLGTTAFTTSTLYNGDSVTGVTLTSSGSPVSAIVGTYDIVPSAATGSGLTNYSISYVNGKDTVKAAALTITAKNQSKIYGATQTLGTTAFTTTSLYNSDSVTGVTLTSSGNPASATVGTYDIVPSAATGSGLTNYSISYINGKDTVKVAPLTITAKNQSKVYGTAQTLGTTAVTALTLYNSDSVTGVTLSSDGSAASAVVGVYDIVPSAATGSGLSNYSISYVNGKDTVNKAPLTITAKDTSKVYGATITFAGTEFTPSTLYNGDQVTSVTLTSAGVGALASVTNSPYSIMPSAAQGTGLSNYNITYKNGNLTVTPYVDCGAFVYNGITFTNTDIGSTSTTVNLSLVITTPNGGNASSATVRFYNISSGSPVLIGTATPGPSSGSQATYSYQWTVNIGTNNLSSTNTISWDVSGNFSNKSCSDSTTDVTVSSRTSDFLTGGGYVVLNPTTNATKSFGKYAGAAGTKTNFGFNVKWNKSLTNIQGGGFTAIIRTATITYQLKAVKVTTLGVTPANGTTPALATFTSGNATLTSVDPVTGVITTYASNANLTIDIADVCEPGGGNTVSSDLIGITLKDGKTGQLLYSNNWDGTKTIKQALSGGNLQIHNDANTPAPLCSSALNTVASLKNDMPRSTTSIAQSDLIKDPGINPLSVTVYPNPSPNSFNISMKGGSDEKVDVTVSDVLGHLMKRYRVAPGTSIALGDDFGVGVYIVQVRQGQTFKYYRIYKAPN